MSLKLANGLRNFTLFICLVMALWTLTVGALFYQGIALNRHHTNDKIDITADSSLSVENVIRAWGAAHGGVYVEVNKKTPPNPNLAHIPERDITTPSGRKLTLMNPAYMIRQLNEGPLTTLGTISHLTSLKPLRAANRPDAWEKKALTVLLDSGSEFREEVEINGSKYLRVMRPLITKRPCLKCHAQQGYKVGEQRGGSSISIPLQPYLDHARGEIFTLKVSFISLWFFGGAFIWLTLTALARRDKARDEAQKKLHEYKNRLEEIVEERTGKLIEVNEKLEEETAISKGTAEKYGEQSRFLQTTLDALTHPFYVIDANDFTIKLANSALDLDKYGENPTCHQVTHNSDTPCDSKEHPCSIMEVKRTRQPAMAEHIHYNSAGEPRYHEVHAYPIFDSAGEVYQIIEYSLDITKRKKAEMALKEAKLAAESASRTKSEFIANLSHEIRTPMNGIMGMADLLMATDVTPEKQREYLGLIQLSSNRLLDTINDILDFSKMEAGKISLIDVSFDLHHLLKELIRVSRVSALEKGLILDYEIEAGTPALLCGDPGRLRQVLINLIDNAIKFTEKGSVKLTVKKDRELKRRDGRQAVKLIFTVQDTGIGIAPEHKSMIFDAFTQADGSMTRSHEGTGLGLSIVAKLTRMMGGRNMDEKRTRQRHIVFLQCYLRATGRKRPGEQTGATFHPACSVDLNYCGYI